MDWRLEKQRTKKLRKTLMKYQGGRCAYCGKKTENLTIDHVVPQQAGGRTEIGNLVLACRDCNLRKAASLTPRHREQLRQCRWLNLG